MNLILKITKYLLFLLVTLMLFSCSRTPLSITKRHFRSGWYVENNIGSIFHENLIKKKQIAENDQQELQQTKESEIVSENNDETKESLKEISSMELSSLNKEFFAIKKNEFPKISLKYSFSEKVVKADTNKKYLIKNKVELKHDITDGIINTENKFLHSLSVFISLAALIVFLINPAGWFTFSLLNFIYGICKILFGFYHYESGDMFNTLLEINAIFFPIFIFVRTISAGKLFSIIGLFNLLPILIDLIVFLYVIWIVISLFQGKGPICC